MQREKRNERLKSMWLRGCPQKSIAVFCQMPSDLAVSCAGRRLGLPPRYGALVSQRMRRRLDDLLKRKVSGKFDAVDLKMLDEMKKTETSIAAVIGISPNELARLRKLWEVRKPDVGRGRYSGRL